MRHKLLSIAQSMRLPSICVLCNQFHANRTAVCSFCMGLLPRLGTCCHHCAHPLFTDDYPICGLCIKNPPFFDEAVVSYSFTEPLRSLLHQFKYYNKLYLGSFFSQLILNGWQQTQPHPQCLIPVPMHAQKIKARGFNQTIILTRLLARKLKIPANFTQCKKIINTAAQANLTREERQKNVRGVFQVKPVPYEHVALVDDLLTTGSTANELARSLKNAGVKRVDIWCCARTINQE